MNPERPLGELLDWKPVRAPEPGELAGRHVLLRPLRAAADADSLYAESHPPSGPEGVWTYLLTGPYADAGALRAELLAMERSRDPLFFALVPRDAGRPAGIASYLRITPAHGVIEIGHIWFGTSLRRTTAATEAIFLLAAHVFDELGYRRLEWKCDALNAASRRAADRFGFVFEGIFAKHMVVKGRNRDTAWYSITDDRWPSVRAGFRAWLAGENQNPAGSQRRPLRELIAAAARP